jgi:hypothetical protein
VSVSSKGRPSADEVQAVRRARVTADEAKKVGDARRVYEAELRSGWDNYRGAIAAARAGDVSRLVDCLRGRKPLTDGDYELLAAYIARKVRRRRWPAELVCALSGAPTDDADFDLLAELVESAGRAPGGMLDEPVHRAARLAEVLMSLVSGRIPAAMRTAMIELACEIESDDADVAINPEQVRDLLNRPKARRHKH